MTALLGVDPPQTAWSDRILEFSPARTRAGRRFAPTVELGLSAVLRDLASRLPGAASGVIVIAEMSGPTGLPDLVALPVTPLLSNRLALACAPLLTFADARLAAACSVRRPMSEAVLGRRLDLDLGSIHRRARRLHRDGALVAAGSGWMRAPGLEPVGRLYALEAKVDDWDAGLSQALRYGAWADASAAVMSQLPRDPSRAITKASRLGLGLALGPRWLVRPKLRRLTLAYRLWASEHLVASLNSTAFEVSLPETFSRRVVLQH